MVNIYAPNYRVLRCARVEVNWGLVLEYHERDPRFFFSKIACPKRGERKREGRTRKRISGNWRKRYEINRRCLSDDEVEINLDPNLLILSTR